MHTSYTVKLKGGQSVRLLPDHQKERLGASHGTTTCARTKSC